MSLLRLVANQVSRRDSREYAQRVAAVNREVIYSVRPGISEGNIPTTEVLYALIASTCRKYGVGLSDALAPEQISEELVKEVMDSSFISSAIKQEYCAKLLKSQLDAPPDSLSKPPALTPAPLRTESVELMDRIQSRMLAQLSAALGVMVAILTMTLTLFKDLLETSFFKYLTEVVFSGPTKDFILPVLVLLASVVGMLATPLVTKLMRDLRIIVPLRDSRSDEKTEAKDA